MICGIFDTLMIDIRQISVSTSISKLKQLNIDVLSPLHSLQEEDQLPFIAKNISHRTCHQLRGGKFRFQSNYFVQGHTVNLPG